MTVESQTLSARAIRERRIIHDPDVLSDACYSAKGGWRGGLAVPMMRHDNVVGVIFVGRAEPGLFNDNQVTLLRTFADQAVIAIENTRLFEAEQARTRELQEALEQQKASAEILSVISNSASDPAPVFNKILECCQHLFGGDELMVNLVDEHGMLQIAAIISNAPDVVAATFPAPVDITPSGRALGERRVIHYPDVVNGLDTTAALRRVALIAGYKSAAFAPMVWQEWHRRRRCSPLARSLQRQRVGSPARLRRPSRHRHREHAAVRGSAGSDARAHRSPGTADGHGRRVEGDQPFGSECAKGTRCTCRVRGAPVRCV